MNVCILAWKTYPYYVGGIEIHTYELAKHLAMKGANVILVTSKPKHSVIDKHIIDSELDQLMENNIKIYTVSTWDVPKIKVAWDGVLFTRRILSLKEENIDIIHLQSCNLTAPSAILLKKIKNIPLIMTTHGSELREKSNFVNEMYKKITLSNVNALIAVSNYQKTIIKENYPYLLDKTIVIPNGVNLPNSKKKKQSKSDKYVVTFIGRLVPIKGPEIFIKMAEIILKYRNDVEFYVIGDGPNRKAIEHYVKERGLTNVIFWGYRTGKEKEELLERTDILVSPLLSGITLLEGMAHGIACVVGNINWAPEVIVDGVNGLLSNPNPAELAEKVISLLDSDKYRNKIGLNALKTIREKYTWEKIAENTLNLYKSLL